MMKKKKKEPGCCHHWAWTWGFVLATVAEICAMSILLGLIFFGDRAIATSFDIMTFDTTDFGLAGASGGGNLSSSARASISASSKASATPSNAQAPPAKQNKIPVPRLARDSDRLFYSVRDTNVTDEDAPADADPDAFVPVAGTNGTNGTAADSAAIKAVLDNSPAWKSYRVWNFMSQHLMATTCVGIFEDDTKATRKVQQCRRTGVWKEALAFNVTATIDAEMESGPKNTTIDQMAIADDWREDLSPTLDTWARNAFRASLLLYLCFAFTVVGLAASVRAWFTMWYETEDWVDMWEPPWDNGINGYRYWPDIADATNYGLPTDVGINHVLTFSDYHRNVWIRIKFYLSLVAAALVLSANVVMVTFGDRTRKAVNEAGPGVGVTAKLGTPYQVAVWFAWACLTASAVYWFWFFRKRGLLVDARDACWKCICITRGRKMKKWGSMSESKQTRLVRREAKSNRQKMMLRDDNRPFIRHTPGKWMHRMTDGLEDGWQEHMDDPPPVYEKVQGAGAST